MKLASKIGLLACVLALGAGVSFAGINSKEVGALLIYPEYWATEDEMTGVAMATYITITNDKPTPVNAHVEIVGGDFCDDCNFDVPLTGFQTKRLLLVRADAGSGPTTLVIDSSPLQFTSLNQIITACPEEHGFVVVSLEAAVVGPDGVVPAEPRRSLGENMLHGDEVVVNLVNGSATQVGAIAVQGIGPNDGDRNFEFDNVEYKAFPSVVTTNFWSANPVVDPVLILLNVNFRTGIIPFNSCALNFVDAEENMFSRSYNFDCWEARRLVDIAPGVNSIILGESNGFLWAQCTAGTHGALLTHLDGSFDGYPYSLDSEVKDTLFQSVTTNPTAVLSLTPATPSGTP